EECRHQRLIQGPEARLRRAVTERKLAIGAGGFVDEWRVWAERHEGPEQGDDQYGKAGVEQSAPLSRVSFLGRRCVLGRWQPWSKPWLDPRSVTHQITGKKEAVMAAMKYQLPA